MPRTMLLLTVCLIVAIWAIPGDAATDEFDAAPPAALPLHLTMEKAIELAVAHNEAVRIADEAITEAEGTYTEYAADAFPQINGSAMYTRNLKRPYTMADYSAFDPLMAQLGLPPMGTQKTYLANNHAWDFRITAEQNIFTFGKVSNALALGSIYKKVAHQQKALAVKDVILQTKEAFLTVLFAVENVKVAESNLARIQETRDVVADKVKQGVMSRFDLLIVESELAAAKPKLLGAQRDRDTATQALLNVIGESLEREVEIVGSLDFEHLDADPTVLVDRARLARPELRALELQQDMYQASYKLSRALYFPTLRANGSYAYTGGSDKRIYPNEDDEMQEVLSFGVSLYIPLFDGLRAAGQMKQMAARRTSAALQYTQASRGIALEVTQLVREVQVAEQMVDANLQGQNVAEEAYRLSELRFSNGLGTRLEVSEARDNLNMAMLGTAASLYNLNVARARLDRALGN